MDNLFWCIGGGILQKPLIEEARRLGYRVIVTDGSEKCICARLADLFFAVDIFDIEGHIALAEELSAEHDIVGVLAAGIDAPITMSKVAEHLGLPGVSSKISEIVHYKSKFRDFCKNNNISVPNYKLFHESEILGLDEYLNKIDLPFIIKNVDSSGSRGTKIFYSRNRSEEQRVAREAIEFSKSRSFLVESVWLGKECTVETLYDVDGEFHRCFITDRVFDYSTGFPIETQLISPSRLADTAQEECFELAEVVSRKLGINIGAAKFDMIYTNDGPRIIEMTTRLSGGFDCQYLVPCASGLNVMGAAILTACGRNFPKSFLVNQSDLVAVTKSHWPNNGRIVSISGVEKARSMKGIQHIFFRKNVGDEVAGFQNCVDRISFILATGDDFDEAERNALNAINAIDIEIQ